MSDHLTELLHASAERVPVAVRPAPEARRKAERARRVRRVAGGVLVGAAVGAVALGVGQGGGTTSEPSPITTPSPTPAPVSGVYTLTRDPFLSGVGWSAFWGSGGAGAPSVGRTNTEPTLMECIGDVDQMAPETRAATYVLQGGGYNNEFVLRYDNSASAYVSFFAMRAEFLRCHRQQSNPGFEQGIGSVQTAPYRPINDLFAGEGHTTSRDKDLGIRPGHYQVYVARQGNVIVAVESYGGWGDRPNATLGVLLDKALGPDWSTR